MNMDEESVRQHLENLSHEIADMEVRREQRMLEEIKRRGPRNGWIRNEADEIFTMDGLECWIWHSERAWEEFRKCNTILGRAALPVGYNGYVCFPKKPVIEPGYLGILAYIPVHGGITYAHHDEVGSVYGFDTGHHDSHHYPILDRGWIREQIDVMARGILLAASVEEEYLRLDGDNEGRAKLVEPFADLAPEQKLNFLTMLNLLSGEL